MEDEKDPKEYEQEFLADAKRRAYDEELEMLANIAIIRSTMLGQREQIPEERVSDGKSRQRELERRLLLRMNMERQTDEDEIAMGMRPDETAGMRLDESARAWPDESAGRRLDENG